MKESLKNDRGPLVTCRGFSKSNESIAAATLNQECLQML